jgi:hypothetical protein
MAEMEAQANFAEMAEEQLAEESELAPDIAADAEFQHQSAVERQIAEAEARNQATDALDDYVPDESLTYDPDGREPDDSAPAPRKLRRLYVRRGACHRYIREVTLQRGEPVYIKKAGKYEQVGEVSQAGRAPKIYVEND